MMRWTNIIQMVFFNLTEAKLTSICLRFFQKTIHQTSKDIPPIGNHIICQFLKRNSYK
nr:MAG TPA: hypothetical protein [Caudoviricetes sp.]